MLEGGRHCAEAKLEEQELEQERAGDVVLWSERAEAREWRLRFGEGPGGSLARVTTRNVVLVCIRTLSRGGPAQAPPPRSPPLPAQDIDAAQLDDELAASTASLDHLDLTRDEPPQPSTSAVPHQDVPLDDLVRFCPPPLTYDVEHHSCSP